ncbi:MAG: hypothetical protein HQL69_21885 [Magnetococcales bacterium]|nr:hypothetical protein [Magnetococcales bacterium]
MIISKAKTLPVVQRTLTEEAQKIFHMQEVWNLLSAAYNTVPGGLNFTSHLEMVRKTSDWNLSYSNNSIVCALLSKPKAGQKVVAFGATADKHLRPSGKKALTKTIEQMLKNNCWMEVSEKAESFVLSIVGSSFIVPNNLAAALTNKRISNLSPDGIHYTREICGLQKTKMIVGTPVLS